MKSTEVDWLREENERLRALMSPESTVIDDLKARIEAALALHKTINIDLDRVYCQICGWYKGACPTLKALKGEER